MKIFTSKRRGVDRKRMRIAYATLHWPRSTSSSTGKKIQRHMEDWRKDGHEVSFFSHMHPNRDQEGLVPGKYFVYDLRKGVLGRLKTEFSRIKAASDLVCTVRAYQPDIIYLRWSMYVYPIHRLLRLAPTVVEVNTNDIEEHKLLGWAAYFYNRLTRGILLRNAAGLVFATREMSELAMFKKFGKPGIIVTNSLDLEKIPVHPAPANQQPHLLFIGTPGMPWHGEDKLVDLAEKFPDLFIDILGIDHIVGHEELPPNIHLHGFLRGKEYEAILSQADAAIGTLSLHKKGMEEAAPFKIRDCAARGIPCILPYYDTDLSSLKSEYFLQIPNQEDNIHTHRQKIYDFVRAMRGKRIPRGLIANLINGSVKEPERLRFFSQLISHKKSRLLKNK